MIACQFLAMVERTISFSLVCMQVKFAPGILELPCDVLIPAALETQIHSGNAGNIKVS
jgi:glutamate dehydrogenase/leucine dehydrogenase